MCGRYLTPDEAALERAWQLKAPTGYAPSYNLAPSQLAPVVLARDGDAVLEMFVWGFRPSWSKRSWINARSETALSSRAFRFAAEHQRCLVPATGWYEWQGQKAPRQPWLFHLAGFRPFAFAGIWARPGGPDTDTFAILTRQAPPGPDKIHARMPLVLEPSVHARWLAADCGRRELAGILNDSVSDFEAYKVSPYVNKPENNDASCIKPIRSETG